MTSLHPVDTAPSSSISASTELRMKLELTAPMLRRALAGLWQPAGLTERYLAYLSVMHGVIRASVPMMAEAEASCRQRPDDPLAAALAVYYAEHIVEELNHDDWLLADLAAAGQDPAAVAHGMPPVAVARLVGAQYYWLRHHHPIALLGYIAVMEGNAPPLWLSDKLRASTGLPAAAFRTLHHHAAADLEHRADFDAFLDRLPLGATHRRAIAISALATVDGFTEVLDRLGPRSSPAP